MAPSDRDGTTRRDPALREVVPVDFQKRPFAAGTLDGLASGLPAVASPSPTGSSADVTTQLLPGGGAAPVLATARRRLAAFLVDDAVVTILAAAVISVLGLVLEQPGPEPRPDGLVVFGWTALVKLVLAWLYNALGQSSEWQATPGKRMLGLRVISARGKRIGFRRASVRFAVSVVSAVLAGLGYLMAAWDPRTRTLHDHAADTLVVRS